MAYNTEDLTKQSLEIIKKHNLIFVNDIFAYTPFSKATFYNHKLEQLDDIKSELAKNRINMKISMRAKWYASDNATLQIGLMKLIADDNEAHRLNGTKREVKHDTTDKEINIKIHR
tara:strand:- start:138 stop:485 length:348 start_codon:yes stop_codon:yes gene_type:complete